MGRGFAALPGVRRGYRRADGPVLPRHVPARRQIQPLRRVRHHRRPAGALFDLAMHAAMPEGQTHDPVKVSNDILAEVFLPEPENTAFVAYFGHLVEYDAGYYGYAWADAIAADMATVFEKSPDGFF